MLNPIEWSSAMSVGVPALDAQHQKIIAVINSLIEVVDTRDANSVVDDALSSLARFAEEHFSLEERLLDEHGCPQLQNQKTEHDAYRMRLMSYCQRHMGDDQVLPSELLFFLRDWWEEHILTEDMQYREFLEAKTG